MKNTVERDSDVNNRNIEDKVTPVSTEYKRNRSVALTNDILPILDDITHVKPNCMRSRTIRVPRAAKIERTNSALPATSMAVNPEIRSAIVIHRYAFLRIEETA